MIDPKRIRADKDYITKNLARRGVKFNLDKVIELDATSIAGLIESEVLRQFHNSSGNAESAKARSDLLSRAVQSSVLAAEQSDIKRKALEAGLTLAEEKKTYAVNLATDYLAQHGINVPHELID